MNEFQSSIENPTHTSIAFHQYDWKKKERNKEKLSQLYLLARRMQIKGGYDVEISKKSKSDFEVFFFKKKKYEELL